MANQIDRGRWAGWLASIANMEWLRSRDLHARAMRPFRMVRYLNPLSLCLNSPVRLK